jgi:hypothetical protein
MMEGLKH